VLSFAGDLSDFASIPEFRTFEGAELPFITHIKSLLERNLDVSRYPIVVISQASRCLLYVNWSSSRASWCAPRGLFRVSRYLMLTNHNRQLSLPPPRVNDFCLEVSHMSQRFEFTTDMGGVKAALALGIPYGSAIPKGRLCEASGGIPNSYTGFQSSAAADLQCFWRYFRPRVLNVAGARESRSPGCEKRVEELLVEVFRG
jgi:hypothetical protein